MADVTITGLPNATVPLSGSERVPMDQNGTTVDASTQAIADLSGAAITAAVNAHVAAADPHPAYLTAAEANAAYEPVGTAASAVAAHVAAADPHPGYLTPAEGNAAYEAAGAVAAHAAAADPHAQYAQTADDVGLGTDDSPTFAGLTITGTAPVNIPHIHGSIAGNFYIHVRNTSGAPLAAGTAVYVTGSVGDTDRLTVGACDPTNTAKMPAVGVLETTLTNNGDGDAIILGELGPFNTAAFSLNQPLYVGAAGLLTGSVPTSGIVQAVGTVARVQSNTGTIVVHIGDRLGTSALRAVGTGAGTVAAGDDARFTDARTPTAHKATHATGGSDALSPADIGAEVAGAASSSMSSHVGQADPHAQYALESNLGTAAALNVGTAAGNVVQLDGAGKLPAVDGSQLTNLPATGVAVTSVTGSAPITSSGGTTPAIGISAATTTAAGSMSAADKVKLDGIEAGAQVNVGTNLSYDAATRLLSSSTGDDATLPLVTSTTPGLASATDKQKIDIAVVSDVTGITGADAVTNIVSVTQAEYDAIASPSASTLYVITS